MASLRRVSPPCCLLRRAVLLTALVLVVLAVVACGPGSTPVRIGHQAERGTPPTPAMELSAPSVAQGSAFSVRLQSANVSAAMASFNGQDYPMVNNGDLWYAIVGIGQEVGSNDVLPPGEYSVAVKYQFAGSHVVHGAVLPVMVTATTFPADSVELPQDLLALLDPNLEAQESAILRSAYGNFSGTQLWQGAFTMPVNGTVTTDFGSRRTYQGIPGVESHAGVDLAVPLGTPVLADAAGRVAWTGTLPDRGMGVIVDHGLGVYSGYFHLSKILAQTGQRVDQGDTLGLAGSTGLSTGPHVHWEIVVNGTNIDAMQFVQLNLP